MSLIDALKSALETVPDCHSVCYVDMSSGLVLAAQSRDNRTQEFFDQMGALATRLLQSPALGAIDRTIAGGSGNLADKSVYVFGRKNTHIFVRAKTIAEHALCFMCANTTDPDALAMGILASRETVADAF